MTKEELSQLAYLCMEVEQDKLRLRELEEAATGSTVQITGMPRQSGAGDRVGKYAAQIADLKAVLETKLERCWQELVRLNRFIAGVPDSEMRQILTLRYIGRKSWQQVAEALDVDGDGSTERKKHDRFLRQQREQAARGAERSRKGAAEIFLRSGHREEEGRKRAAGGAEMKRRGKEVSLNSRRGHGKL